MSETIIICLYIVFGISAVLGLIKELKKPKKNQFLILFESLILIGAIFLVVSDHFCRIPCVVSYMINSILV
ncbi:hypothetical protein BcerKBAB4_5522 (plasmid) [Bacillus mycoides KBAB4]|uniref:Uncharacterized protein n=1 Tax=Bacillus mycoides (strain KBAB4) TaxID=315730 RepID=A9VV72_BACMK|nr:hypothetical protein BcerKBAB4_5522 [Bacillus mycoides KBAB4]